MIDTIDKRTFQLADSPGTDSELFGDDLVYEPKLDGHRFICHNPSVTSVNRGVSFITRSGVDKTHLLPRLVEAMANMPPGVYDGEIGSFRSLSGDWGKAQHVLGSNKADTEGTLEFAIFDVLEVCDMDVRSYPLSERRHLLEVIFAQRPIADSFLQLIPQRPFNAGEIETLIRDGWEGAIVKNPKAPYSSGKRGYSWWKIKGAETIDVTVTGATKGKGEFTGLIGALEFVAPDGSTGRCSGFDMAQRAEFTQLLDDESLTGMMIEVSHTGRCRPVATGIRSSCGCGPTRRKHDHTGSI